MKALMGGPVEMRESRLLRTLAGSSRRLLATSILALAALAVGAGVWAWADTSSASGSSGSATSAAAEDDGLQPGWTNAVEECDCLFGGQ